MRYFKTILLILIFPLFAFTTLHKYYISVTQINYIENKQSVQITSRYFIDDFENALKQSYDKDIVLAEPIESKSIDSLTCKYLLGRIQLIINNEDAKLKFIGKEYEGDIIKCYLEVEQVKSIHSFEISNRVLFDLKKDQQNIIKTEINSKNKSCILTREKPNTLLKFE